jgi:hypothetical protein
VVLEAVRLGDDPEVLVDEVRPDQPSAPAADLDLRNEP